VTVEFQKDQWIKLALVRLYLIVKTDGVILRARKCSEEGFVDTTKFYGTVKQQVHKKSGRVYFNLKFMGITKSVLVNRVVALRFLPNPDNLPVVNHIDGDKENNALLNLEWSTNSDNEKHAHQTGLKSGRGSANSNAKLTATDVLNIRASNLDLGTQARQLGVSVSTIKSVLAGKTWQHL